MRRLDPVQAAAVGIAALATVLTVGGLVLYAIDAPGTAGWTVIVLVAVTLAALAASRDPLRLAVPLLLAAVALGVTVGAVALSHASAVDYARETTFTQLWLVERGGGRAELGVRNEEQMPAAFQVRLFAPQSQGGRVLVDRTLELAPSQAWSQEIVVPRTARPERLNVELYRLGETRSYRSGHIWTQSAP